MVVMKRRRTLRLDLLLSKTLLDLLVTPYLYHLRNILLSSLSAGTYLILYVMSPMSEEDKRYTRMGIGGMEPFTAPHRRAHNVESSRKADSSKTTTTNMNKDEEVMQNLRNEV
jgi:hypothetical protein